MQGGTNPVTERRGPDDEASSQVAEVLDEAAGWHIPRQQTRQFEPARVVDHWREATNERWPCDTAVALDHTDEPESLKWSHFCEAHRIQGATGKPSDRYY